MIKNANELSIRPIVCTLDGTSFTWVVACDSSVNYNLYSRVTKGTSMYKKLFDVITRFRTIKSDRGVTDESFHNEGILVA